MGAFGILISREGEVVYGSSIVPLERAMLVWFPIYMKQTRHYNIYLYIFGGGGIEFTLMKKD